MQQQSPIPLPDELTEGYWGAAAEHRLAIQRCDDCGNYQHPPLIYCVKCQEGTLRFADVSGRATVYSYSKVVETTTPGREAPYTVIIGELIEQKGLWILSNCSSDIPIRVGDELALEFETIAPGVVLPQLRPVVPAGSRSDSTATAKEEK